jgi:hypothetical protein
VASPRAGRRQRSDAADIHLALKAEGMAGGYECHRVSPRQGRRIITPLEWRGGASRGSGCTGDNVPRRIPPAELVSRGLRPAVIETLETSYFTPEIDRLFESEGWSITRDLRFRHGDSPRGRAEAFHDAVDFTTPDEVEAYLVVVGRILDRMTRDEAEGRWPEEARPPQAARLRIEGELRRAGSEPDEAGIWHLPARVEPSAAILEAAEGTGLARIVAAMRRSDCQPEERIGLAKELVESTIKIALERLDQTYTDNEDIPALSKKLHRVLDLNPKTLHASDENAQVAAHRLLVAMTEIPHHLATLRNSVGAGHGRAAEIGGITLIGRVRGSGGRRLRDVCTGTPRSASYPMSGRASL